MSHEQRTTSNEPDDGPRDGERRPPRLSPPPPPIPNYTLSTVCPGCGSATIRRACKVRCVRCGFVWDCAEL